jgi:hypothetical protein
MFGDTQIHENLGYSMNHRFGMFLPKPLPYIHVNDRHFTPPNVNPLRLSKCCLLTDGLTAAELQAKHPVEPVMGGTSFILVVA